MDIKKRIQDLSIEDQAKLYYMGLVRQGKIDRLPDNPKDAFLRQMTKDAMEKDRMKADFEKPKYSETGMEEEVTDKEEKKLKKISKELNKASRMHKSQADRIDKITTEGDTYEKNIIKKSEIKKIIKEVLKEEISEMNNINTLSMQSSRISRAPGVMENEQSYFEDLVSAWLNKHDNAFIQNLFDKGEYKKAWLKLKNIKEE